MKIQIKISLNYQNNLMISGRDLNTYNVQDEANSYVGII